MKVHLEEQQSLECYCITIIFLDSNTWIIVVVSCVVIAVWAAAVVVIVMAVRYRRKLEGKKTEKPKKTKPAIEIKVETAKSGQEGAAEPAEVGRSDREPKQEGSVQGGSVKGKAIETSKRSGATEASKRSVRDVSKKSTPLETSKKSAPRQASKRSGAGTSAALQVPKGGGQEPKQSSPMSKKAAVQTSKRNAG